MPSPLPTLIKLAQKKLEDAQVKLANIEKTISLLQNAKADMLARQLESVNIAANSSDALLFKQAGLFIKKAEIDIKAFDAALNVAQQEREKVLALIRDDFAEKKRFETLQKQTEKKAAKAHADKIQKGLDEIAGTRHKNNQNSR